MPRCLVALIALAAFVATLAACGDKELAEVEAVRAAVCACKTPDCATAAMAKLPQAEIPSDHRTQALAREMLDCLAKLNDAAAAAAAAKTEDPDAGSDSGSGVTPP